MNALTKRQQILAAVAASLAVVLIATGVWLIVRDGGGGDRATPGVAGPAVPAPASPTGAPPDAAGPATMTVTIYLHRGQNIDPSVVVPVRRTVPRTTMVATATLQQLLAGPTAAERRAGYHSDFSAATAGMLRSLRIANGVAHADFRDFSRLMPTAGSSAGTAALLAELDTTLKQFGTVRTTLYSFDDDVAAFYEWLQLSPPVGMPPGMVEAQDVAYGFLTRVVGMDRPVFQGARWRSDAIATATFAYRADDDGVPLGPSTTVVLVRSGVSFTVVEAVTATIRVDEPASAISPDDLAVVSSPLRLAGSAQAFEGTVTTRVVQVAGRRVTTLGRGFVTASGDGMAPFAGRLAFRRPTAGTGWVLAYELSARDGAVSKVTAVRVAFAGLPTEPTISGVRAVAVPPLPELDTAPGEGLARDGWLMPAGAGRITFTVRTVSADAVRLYLAPRRGDTVGAPRLLGTATRSGSTFTYTWRYRDEPLLAQLSVVATSGGGRVEQALANVYHR